jgi:t-SNARE complex subunit (syntaxin)
METQAELLRCRTLDEIHEAQTRFFRTAMDQYAAEATKLMKIGADLMTPAQTH